MRSRILSLALIVTFAMAGLCPSAPQLSSEHDAIAATHATAIVGNVSTTVSGVSARRSAAHRVATLLAIVPRSLVLIRDGAASELSDDATFHSSLAAVFSVPLGRSPPTVISL